jgi:quercetin dioxygenase-like cupin family protein
MEETTVADRAFIVNGGEGRKIHVIGEEVIVKISSRDTGGAFTVIEGSTRPRYGPPLHVHRNQDETFYVVEGEYRFEVDGQEIYATAGATVFAPRGSRHTFQNVGAGTGRIVSTVVPGGLDVFFEDLEAVAPRGTAPDRTKILPVFEKHGMELVGPPLRMREMAMACGAD